ncbi:hypothetical protein Pedsa_2769 [Pseudopedobacter saltans DSM 12145]|uniref:KWG Leptospira repeat protein n=1 Tax=Pseudopedobacter saltans (strain ATCC 51119 / DSM 12145 / JCM 21818 / CCUG 39354 / LMG 10337 / NBRC 100064 / NCIMB 13643) TaxID=762903 RepID=F0S7Q5_PSESL|nr:hypothetical protein Pedsa_2769 [Pseudopedobacter saltans DSM 12145]
MCEQGKTQSKTYTPSGIETYDSYRNRTGAQRKYEREELNEKYKRENEDRIRKEKEERTWEERKKEAEKEKKIERERKSKTFVVAGESYLSEAPVWPFTNKIIIYKYNGKYGLADEKQFLLNQLYEEIRPLKYEMAVVVRNGKYGAINKDLQEVIPFRYDDIQSVGKECLKVKLNGQYLWIDRDGQIKCRIDNHGKNTEVSEGEVKIDYVTDGKNWGIAKKYVGDNGSLDIVIPIEYDEIALEAPYVMVKKKGLYGVKNLKHENILPFKYEMIHYYGGNFFIAYNQRVPVLIDLEGNEILKDRYTNIGSGIPSEMYKDKNLNNLTKKGVFPVECENKWGMVDLAGKEVLPAIYNKLYPVGNGLLKVQLLGKTGVFDYKGKQIIPVEYDGLKVSELSGLLCFIANKDNKCGLIDGFGKETIPFKYQEIGEITDIDRIRVRMDNKWGVVDYGGKEIIPTIYDSVSDFRVERQNGYDRKIATVAIEGRKHTINDRGIIQDVLYKDGVAIVRDQNRKKGVIDERGKTLVPFVYEDISFSKIGGPLLVQRENLWGYINKNGAEVIPTIYKIAKPFFKEIAYVQTTMREWLVIDKTGKVKATIPAKQLTETMYDEVLLFQHVNGKWGVLSWNGTVLLKPKYSKILWYSGYVSGPRLKVWGFPYKEHKFKFVTLKTGF